MTYHIKCSCLGSAAGSAVGPEAGAVFAGAGAAACVTAAAQKRCRGSKLPLGSQ